MSLFYLHREEDGPLPPNHQVLMLQWPKTHKALESTFYFLRLNLEGSTKKTEITRISVSWCWLTILKTLIKKKWRIRLNI